MYKGDQPGDPLQKIKSLSEDILEENEPGMEKEEVKLKEQVYDIDKEVYEKGTYSEGFEPKDSHRQYYGADLTVVYDSVGTGATISNWSESLVTHGAIAKKALRAPKYSLTQLKFIFDVMSTQGFHLYDIELVPKVVQPTLLSFELSFLFYQDKAKTLSYRITELEEGAYYGKWENVCASRLDMSVHSPPKFVVLSNDITKHDIEGERKKPEAVMDIAGEEVEKYYDMMMGLSDKNFWDYTSSGEKHLIVRITFGSPGPTPQDVHAIGDGDIGNVVDFPNQLSELVPISKIGLDRSDRLFTLKDIFSHMAKRGFPLTSFRLVPIRETSRATIFNGYYWMIKFLNIGCDAKLDYIIIPAGKEGEIGLISRTKLSRLVNVSTYDIFSSERIIRAQRGLGMRDASKERKARIKKIIKLDGMRAMKKLEREYK